MRGINEITADILRESEESAKAIIEEANSKASEIKNEADLKIKAIFDETNLLIKKNEESSRNKAIAASELRNAKMLLNKKQELIGETVNMAYEKIMNYDDKDYFDMILSLIGRYAFYDEGEIKLNEKDLKRLPKDFKKRMNNILGDRKLKLSKDAVAIDGGFILSYGGIEENCSIKAMFDSKKDEISDIVQRALF